MRLMIRRRNVRISIASLGHEYILLLSLSSCKIPLFLVHQGLISFCDHVYALNKNLEIRKCDFMPNDPFKHPMSSTAKCATEIRHLDFKTNSTISDKTYCLALIVPPHESFNVGCHQVSKCNRQSHCAREALKMLAPSSSPKYPPRRTYHHHLR